jgi:hypothetical protein
MKTVRKTVEIDVYTPRETLDEFLRWHEPFARYEDRMLVNDKFDLGYLDSDFMLGTGLRVCNINEYLNGYNNYYYDDFFMVFEQDCELYVLTYID